MRSQRPVPALSSLASAKLYTDAQNGATLSVRVPGDCLLAAEQCGRGSSKQQLLSPLKWPAKARHRANVVVFFYS